MSKITLGQGVIERLFNIGLAAVATDNVRPVLKHIEFDITEGTITTRSCDGICGIKCTMSHIEENITPFKCLIKPFKLPKNIESTVIETTEDEVILTLQCGDYTMVINQPHPEQEFINYDKIIPTLDSDLKVAFNAKTLIKILKPFCNKSINKEVIFEFVRDGDGINRIAVVKLSGKDDLETRQAICLPIRLFDYK